MQMTIGKANYQLKSSVAMELWSEILSQRQFAVSAVGIQLS